MAQDEIIIKLRVDDGELKISSANIDKHSKKIDKQTKSKKRGTKASNRFNKAEKGLYQTNLAGAKGFSKMNQTMGGSSGLVAAYATLAANVFAATAAFGALRRAAQFEQLKLGLTELGQQSGRTLSIMAEGLRDVTGGAISAEEAMRAAALGVSGGFGGEQLAGLAKIARGASITLGRSLPDAFDRLTRGAIKLEPEILDELGIMVRLDDAVENYAATIGKAGSALTQMERRQAFMNAILEQGESKFGEIAEAVEPDAYSRLGATFDDLTQSIFNFFNQDFVFGFFGLNEIVGVLADNTAMLFGVMLLFASTIAGKMIPALGNAAQAAADQADKMVHLAHTAKAANKEQAEFLISGLGQVKGQKKAYLDIITGLEGVKNKTKGLAKLRKSLNAQMVAQNALIKASSGAEKKAAIARLVALKAESIQLTELTALEAGKGVAALARRTAEATAASQTIASNIIIARQNKEMTFAQAWRALSKATSEYGVALTVAAEKSLKSGKSLTSLAKRKIFLKKAIFGVRLQLKAMMGEMLLLIAPIALLILAVTAMWAIWNWRNNTEAQKKYNKGTKQLNKLIEELPAKVEKYNKALDNSKNLADGQLRAFEITSGIITELNDKLRENVRLREAADKGWGKDEKLGVGRGLASAAASDSIMAKKTAAMMGFGPAYFVNMENAGDALRKVLQVRKSDEFRTASALLKTGIPDQAAMLQKKLEAIWRAEDKGPLETVKAIRAAIGEVQIAFGNLGPAAKGVRESLKEAEKEGAKFLSTFARKTSMDMFAKATTSAVKAMKELEKTTNELIADPDYTLHITVDETIGKSLLDVGAKMAAMIGPEFLDAQGRLIKNARALEDAKKKGLTGDDLKLYEMAVQLSAKALGRFRGEVVALNDDILETQRLELTKKQILVGINKVIKLASKTYKTNVKLAGLDAQMTLRKLKFEQQITKAKIKQVKKLFEVIKYTKAAKEAGKPDEDMEISRADFLLKSLEDQHAILETTNLTHEQLDSLLGSITEEKLQQLDIDKATESLASKKALQIAEAMQQQLNMVKKIQDLEQTGLKLAAKKEAFLRKGTTKLNAAEEAKLKIDSAQKAYNMARVMAEIEFAIIKAKSDLQIIDLKYLDKQIEMFNEEVKLKKGKDWVKEDEIERIDLVGGEKAIIASAKLQQIAIKQNLNNLQAGLEVALYEGLESFIKAIDDNDINLFQGMTGSSTIFNTLETLEISGLEKQDKANELLQELLTFWEGTTASPDIGVHVREDDTLDPAEQREIKLLAKQAARETGDLRKIADRAAKQAGIDADRAVKLGYPAKKESGMEWLKKTVAEISEKHENRAKIDKGTSMEKSLAIYSDMGTYGGGEVIESAAALVEAAEEVVGKIAEKVPTILERILSVVESVVAKTLDLTFVSPIDPLAKTTDSVMDQSVPYSGTGATGVPVEGDSDFVGPPRPDKDPVPDVDGVLTYTKALLVARLAQAEFTKEAMKWGPEGEAYAAMMEGFLGEEGLVVSIKAFTDSTGSMMEKLSLAGDVISAMGNIMASSSKMMVAQIDNQIAAEKAKDGSSKSSLAKIKEMEGKKLAIQKKAFETKKKIAIATTMINIVTAVVEAWKEYGWPWGAVLGAVIAAMGMKQIAMIQSQQFTGGAGAIAADSPSSITIGKRANKVDVSQQASAGELAYLRGERGIGSTATDFRPMGGAAGLRRGYQTGGEILVGEQGPEMITPLSPMQVWPSGQGMKSQINANFTIHAIDAAGVEEVLLGQQGNIINMIRTAANDYGEDFLEAVNVDTYGETDSGYGGG